MAEKLGGWGFSMTDCLWQVFGGFKIGGCKFF